MLQMTAKAAALSQYTIANFILSQCKKQHYLIVRKTKLHLTLLCAATYT